jgi:hypothetical protein
LCSFCGRDLWEVDRFVFGGAVICDVCVDQAQHVLEDTKTSGARGVAFPPRVFGEVPDRSAASDIVDAYSAVFGAHVTPTSGHGGWRTGTRLGHSSSRRA